MRIILACNVIISAALTSGGTAAQAVRKAESHHTLLASPETLKGFSAKLLNPKFDSYFSPLDTRIEIISRYTNLIEWVVPNVIVSICRDPTDNRYLELIVSGKANCLVTGDPDLLILNPFQDVPIISPKEFLEKF